MVDLTKCLLCGEKVEDDRCKCGDFWDDTVFEALTDIAEEEEE